MIKKCEALQGFRWKKYLTIFDHLGSLSCFCSGVSKGISDTCRLPRSNGGKEGILMIVTYLYCIARVRLRFCSMHLLSVRVRISGVEEVTTLKPSNLQYVAGRYLGSHDITNSHQGSSGCSQAEHQVPPSQAFVAVTHRRPEGVSNIDMTLWWHRHQSNWPATNLHFGADPINPTPQTKVHQLHLPERECNIWPLRDKSSAHTLHPCFAGRVASCCGSCCPRPIKGGISSVRRPRI